MKIITEVKFNIESLLTEQALIKNVSEIMSVKAEIDAELIGVATHNRTFNLVKRCLNAMMNEKSDVIKDINNKVEEVRGKNNFPSSARIIFEPVYIFTFEREPRDIKRSLLTYKILELQPLGEHDD